MQKHKETKQKKCSLESRIIYLAVILFRRQEKEGKDRVESF